MSSELLKYTIAFGMQRDQGLVRQENQDQILHFQSGVFGNVFIVADGMGGHEGGAIAANMTITGFKQHFQKVSFQMPLRESIAEAARLTNLDIFEKSNEKGNGGNPLRMGSTLVLCVIAGNYYTVANAGDSRCYSFRNGALKKLTRDHTAAQKMVDSGIISADEARNHPDASVLTRAFGQRPEIEIDVSEPFEVAPDERLLLCSDGLYGYVDEAAIVDRLQRFPDPQAAADALLQLALDAGGHDNISIFVIRVDPPSRKGITAPDPPEAEEVAAVPAPAAPAPVAPKPAPARSKGVSPLAIGMIALSLLIVGGAGFSVLRSDLLPAPLRDRLEASGIPAGVRARLRLVAGAPARGPMERKAAAVPVAEPPAVPDAVVAPATNVFIAYPPSPDPEFLKQVETVEGQLSARGYHVARREKPLEAGVWRAALQNPVTFAPPRFYLSAVFFPGFRPDALKVCGIAICSDPDPKPVIAGDREAFLRAFPAGAVILFAHPASHNANNP